MREKKTNKILVLGVDGMDPKLTRRFVDEGVMPNTAELLARGAARHDLVMLGGMPTVTPPMWTTLACGCSPMVHGITCFSRQSDTALDEQGYNLDSRNCKAEPVWNVFAESDRKTLVWHWPGSSWPPTSDSPNLHVVDGTQPGVVNMGVAQVESELVLLADVRTPEATFREKAVSDGNIPCVITDLQQEEKADIGSLMTAGVKGKGIHNIIISTAQTGNNLTDKPFDIVISPIREAKGWAAASDAAKEMTILLSKGLIRRVGLLEPNVDGVYDTLKVYKSKQSAEPLGVLPVGEFVEIIDECIKGEAHYQVNRMFRILEMNEDGTRLKLWISAALDITNNSVWHPQRLFDTVTTACGYPPAESNLGGSDWQLMCNMNATWDVAADWQAKALHKLIETEQYDAVFSHFHNVDAQGHMSMRFLKDKGDAKLPHEQYVEFVRMMYTQTDRYLGQFLHYLDDGWTIFVVSDHAQISSEYNQPFLGSGAGTNVLIMQELGFTYVKTDADGNLLPEIDWSRTKAIASRSNHIYINLKGRDEHGIVEPSDQYELEEEIMTALYGYKHPESGKRIVSLALRRKDAVLLGLGGEYPQCGDIIYFMAEGYNVDHADCLSTTLGYEQTSVSPIFFAAGQGIKAGYETERYIREYDLAPTVAYMSGLRMPRECEGAPVYQIIEGEM